MYLCSGEEVDYLLKYEGDKVSVSSVMVGGCDTASLTLTDRKDSIREYCLTKRLDQSTTNKIVSRVAV